VSISADVPQFGHAGRNPSRSDPLDLDHAKSRVGVSVYIQEQAERPNGKVPFLLGAKHGDGGSIGLDHRTQSSPYAISPQTAANGRKSVRQNKLGFPILSDVKGNISSAFGPR
jgi:hypothetical protein